MNEGMAIECDFHFGKQAKGRKTVIAGVEADEPKGRLTKVTQWVALAIKLDGLIRFGASPPTST